MMKTRNHRVHYTKEMDNILKDKVKENPHNKMKGFREAAAAIRKLKGGEGVTPERLSTRYYTEIDPVGSKRKPIQQVSSDRVGLFVDLGKELSREEKLQVAKNFIGSI